MNLKNKYFFIINPKAGKGRGSEAIHEIKKRITDSDIDAQIVITEYQKHATEIAKNLPSDFNNVISVGGDGTLNEVINGIDLNKKLSLGLLPVGSGNDYSFSLGQRKSFNDNFETILSYRINGKQKNQLRLGLIKYRNEFDDLIREHKFANAMGVGFDALVAHFNQQNKKMNGIISYLIAIIRAIRYYAPLEIETWLNEHNIIGDKLLISVAKGKTSGGGFYLTPTAELFNDDFGICIIEFVKRFKLIRSLPLAIVNKLDTLKEAFLTNSSEIEINLKKSAYIHADGEIISKNAVKINVTLLRANIQIIA